MFLKKEDGYTFSLNLTFLFVTFGIVMIAMLMWFGSASAAYFSLRNAANGAAFAAQAQAVQSDTGSGSGFTSSVGWVVQTSYQNAADKVFQSQVNNANLENAFSGLQCMASLNGNQISVSVSGSYLPLFLQNISQKFPQIEALSIPMKVTLNEEYKVVG